MAFRLIALLCLASVLCSYSEANADAAVDCCLTTKNKEIPNRIVKSFKIQTVEGGCMISATVFTTKRGFKLCAPPAHESHWVEKLIKKLQKKNGKSKRTARGA
ncbi:C-C motif chemokine 19-like [Paramormyrops kingsleyae]|uniref:C-C motif chemokine 19-like n=1 Tax=Paramormyrops kingsleyae TaxID=1676925 RepID=A0A3B3SIV7_9TELE|nr:C-C motif chemokine 19-like [Paramormyrops kingsleyae]